MQITLLLGLFGPLPPAEEPGEEPPALVRGLCTGLQLREVAAERGHGLGGGESPLATRLRVFFTCAANTLFVMRPACRLRLFLLPSLRKVHALRGRAITACPAPVTSPPRWRRFRTVSSSFTPRARSCTTWGRRSPGNTIFNIKSRSLVELNFCYDLFQ